MKLELDDKIMFLGQVDIINEKPEMQKLYRDIRELNRLSHKVDYILSIPMRFTDWFFPWR